MQIDGLFSRDDCKVCGATPSCNCAADQECFVVSRDCYNCASIKCISSASSGGSSTGSGGVSSGALAGAVIGVLVALALIVGGYFWWRRRQADKKAADPNAPKDKPASAADVLSRPDPIEKPTSRPPTEHTVRVYSSSSNTTIDLDPESQSHRHVSEAMTGYSNPFDDANSIQTAGTEGTNVIPIALVTPEIRRSGEAASETSSLPTRPPRSPNLDLNLEHVNVSRDNVMNGSPSARSGVSAFTSRNSYQSNASYSSDFLNDTPVIITPSKGAVRQVLGAVKAELVSAPPGQNGDGLKVPGLAPKPAASSPLAVTSFGPSDIVREEDENVQELEIKDPFSDVNASALATGGFSSSSPHGSTTTFGGETSRDRHDSELKEPTSLPWANAGGSSRPSSVGTQAGSIIDIGSATRVQVGFGTVSSAGSTPATDGFPRSPYRTTMGRLVTPPAAATGMSGSLVDQQQEALAHAQAQAAQARGRFAGNRTSATSVMTTASRTDSLLEAFPFVPPSPISNLPTRTPPASPLSQQTMHPNIPPIPTLPKSAANIAEESDLPAPPSRKMLGMSTASQMSTASSGLGSFPFQIDSDPGSDDSHGAAPPTSYPQAYNDRHRASLDTLAITSDLSSFPLGFDRDNVHPHDRKS
ncbi:hypothetical protein BD626DRAFT_479281 [Schizophyllum amplum]|uniref:Membrane anchor Opy2 N-terminal domain-containing protein n=1 Tax=Schizophyllum amplum TaxID=97359 RepID=A0A550CS45_9AGAR|nr:hypothetical protein BD626DRAFT_479281 [Auriculariopsis ampla]